MLFTPNVVGMRVFQDIKETRALFVAPCASLRFQHDGTFGRSQDTKLPPYLKACSSFSCAANTVLKKNAENFAGLVLRFFLLTVCIERRLIFWSEEFDGFGMASFDREWKVTPRISAAKRPLQRGVG